MLKKLLAAAAMLYAVASWAAVDVNKATDAQLDSIKGVGPAMSKRIVEERKLGEFKDWPDLMHRVKGLKEKAAAKLSAEGLTVNGQSFNSPAPAAGKSAKSEGKKAEPEPMKTASKP